MLGGYVPSAKHATVEVKQKNNWFLINFIFKIGII